METENKKEIDHMLDGEQVKERTYNVKEVAEILGVNQETVRRWIRDKKLEATIESKKKGHVVTEKALFELKQGKEGKERKELALSLLSATKDILELQTERRNVWMEQKGKLEEAQRRYGEAYKKAVGVNIRKIEGEIKEREEATRIKQACIEQLKKEIERDQKEISELKKKIMHLQKQQIYQSGEKAIIGES